MRSALWPQPLVSGTTTSWSPSSNASSIRPWQGYRFDPAQPSLEEASGWLGGRTGGRSSRPADDDLPSGVALFQVRDCCGDFGERIAPVDVGPHLAGFNQVGEELQLRGGYLR